MPHDLADQLRYLVIQPAATCRAAAACVQCAESSLTPSNLQATHPALTTFIDCAAVLLCRQVINLSIAAYVSSGADDADDTLRIVCQIFKEASDAGASQ
jgi:hypothetical protein